MATIKRKFIYSLLIVNWSLAIVFGSVFAYYGVKHPSSNYVGESIIILLFFTVGLVVNKFFLVRYKKNKKGASTDW